MRENPIFITAAIACHLLLGFVVFVTNPRRPINRNFLLITIILAGWVAGIEFSFIDTDLERVGWWIRVCSAWGALAPVAIAVLHTSIIHYDESWGAQLRRMRPWIVLAFVFSLYCLSPYYLKSVGLASAPGAGVGSIVPRPVFHPAVFVHYAYLLVSACTIAYMMIRDQFRPRVSGVHRVELQFIWLCAMTIFATTVVSVALQLVMHGGRLIRHAAFLRVIIFDVIIAYGITSRGIMQIRAVVRLTLSYLLLSLYAGVIYALGWVVLRWFFLYAGVESPLWPSVLAGGLAAMLVNSLSTPFRRFARHILPTNDLDFERTFGKVRHLLQSVATLNELLDDFCGALAGAVGTPSVRVLLPSVRGFSEMYTRGELGLSPISPGGLCLPDDDIIVHTLQTGAADVAIEELVRHASTPDQRALLGRLRGIEADLIVPARYRGELSAVIVLSPRVGGRIYGGDGRSTLRLIAEQLGVAIVNAHLYTEAYRSQAYNRLLVEHLPCGVITTDPAGIVRVLNPEARRLLQVDESIVASEIELPASFADLVGPTLRTHVESVTEEIILRSGSRDQANLRVNCLPLEGEHGEVLGAVLVLNDHTALERLQRAVRQADRLASIGTLASGMAHEIKNPLTALKTFTQLLPKRYNDAEFRHDFSGLAGSEIARIERIVNQLLAFARPAPLMIEQVNLHEIVGNAVKLVGPQASRHQVSVRASLNADTDYIAADKDRLQQVLLNLLLNAIQANTDGGWIEVVTETEPGTPELDAFIRLDVKDGGNGIPEDILPHIFDPFFTTKGEGTGLGLSVSYNIVAEHKGRLEVHSEAGKGTCFSLYLPVC